MQSLQASTGAIILTSLLAQGCATEGCFTCSHDPQRLAREDLSRVFEIDSALSAQIRGQTLVTIEIQKLLESTEKKLHEACEGLLTKLDEKGHSAEARESCRLAREAIVRTKEGLGPGARISIQTPPLLCAASAQGAEPRYRDCIQRLTSEAQTSCEKEKCPTIELENTCRLLAALQARNDECPPERANVTIEGAARPVLEKRLRFALHVHMGEIIELARTLQSTNQRLRQADDLIDSSRTRYRELYEDSSKAVSLKICLARNNAKTKNHLANLAALTREAEEIRRTVYETPTETMPQ